MTSRLEGMVVDSRDPRRPAEFWCAVLGYVVYADDGHGKVEIGPDPEVPDGERLNRLRAGPDVPSIAFVLVPESKAGKNRLHFDIAPIDADQDIELARLIELDAGLPTVVMLSAPGWPNRYGAWRTDRFNLRGRGRGHAEPIAASRAGPFQRGCLTDADGQGHTWPLHLRTGVACSGDRSKRIQDGRHPVGALESHHGWCTRPAGSTLRRVSCGLPGHMVPCRRCAAAISLGAGLTFVLTSVGRVSCRWPLARSVGVRRSPCPARPDRPRRRSSRPDGAGQLVRGARALPAARLDLIEQIRQHRDVPRCADVGPSAYDKVLPVRSW